jgi:hypothetical protein
MSDPTPYEQIVQHLDNARRFVSQSLDTLDAGDVNTGGALAKLAREAFDAAELLADIHRPTVVFNTVRTGQLRELVGLEWARVWDGTRGVVASVRWSDIEGEAPA